MSDKTEHMINLLASRLKSIRLKKNITQHELAALAGLSVNAIKGAEKGECHLKTFCSIVLALGMDDVITNMFPEQLPSPVDVTLKGSEKKRASKNMVAEKDEVDW